jgi:transposase-like protein
VRARGLDGVRRCLFDAHAGLKAAIAQVLGCPVHFLRDLLGHVSRTQQPLVSGGIGGIFTATSAAQARQRLDQVVDQPLAPKVARLLEDAEADLLACSAFPAEHWPKLGSTNPLERVNREIGRRTGRGRDLPQRRGAAAPCRDAAAGAERRVAGRSPLPVGVVHGLVLAASPDQHPDSPDHKEVPQLTAP